MASVTRRAAKGLAVATAASGIALVGLGAPASAGPYTDCYQQSQDPVDGYTTEDPATNTQCTTNPNGTFIFLHKAVLPSGGTLRVKVKIVGSVKGRRFANVFLVRRGKLIRLRLQISPNGFVSFARVLRLRGFWALTIAYGGNTIATNFRVT